MIGIMKSHTLKKLPVITMVALALACGGAIPAQADTSYGMTGYLGITNPNRAAFAEYYGTNANAGAGMSLIRASDLRTDGNSALTVLQKKQNGKWIEIARVIASNGVNTSMKRGVVRPARGTNLRLTSCLINMSAPAAKRVGYNCSSTTFYAA